MRLLLDTHVFLWFISADPRLEEKWTTAIETLDNEVFLSVVSIWEALAKHGKGKLSLPGPAAAYLSAQRTRHRIASLPLAEAEVLHVSSLPMIHKDPFDRMLVCQAQINGLTIATGDSALLEYDVPIL